MIGKRITFDSRLDDALVDQMLAEAGVADSPRASGVVPRGHAHPVQLSYGQELLWLLDHSSPGLTAYNIPIARQIVGPLDADALEKSLALLVARHEIFRTRFPVVDGHAMQVVEPPGRFVLHRIDVEGQRAQREQEARRIVIARARTPFDLAAAPAFRATLVRIDELDSVLLLETHHIACDGWSIGVILHELSAMYRSLSRGAAPDLPALELQYADYAAWERQTVAGDALESLLAYWRAELGGATESLDLPTDFPRANALTFEGVHRSVTLEPELSDQLRSATLAAGLTPHMALLAAFATVLHRYTGRANVVIGSNVAARAESELDGVIGYFNKTLPLRVDFAGDPTFAQLLERVRASSLGAYDHQEIPIEMLANELHALRPEIAQGQLFDVVLTAQVATPGAFALDGLTVDPYPVDLGATKFDFTLFTSESGGSLRLTLRARSELWRVDSIERCLGHIGQVLRSSFADPSQRISALPMLADEERAALDASNATSVNVVAPSVLDCVEAAMARFPDRIAVVHGTERITYGQLAERVHRLARRLAGCGVAPGGLVGLLLERSIDAVAAIVAIWRVGAAYVPLAPDLPSIRIAEQIGAIDCRHIVTDRRNAGAVNATDPDQPTRMLVVDDDRSDAVTAGEAPRAAPAAESLAYVLFTSGTTGTPKAVGVSHSSLANYVRAITRVIADVPPTGDVNELEPLADWHFAMVSTLAADLGHTSLFPALGAGATLHAVQHDVATDPTALRGYLRAEGIDVLKITPSHLRALLGATESAMQCQLLPSRWLIVGGERFAWDLADEIERARIGSGCRVLNHYGPTETTVGALTFELTASTGALSRALGAQSVPVGRPLANVQVHVRDQKGQLLPIGIPGELSISGAGVARGYLNDCELTARRFVERAGAGRAYRTGDRVRRLPSGDIEFLERLDSQVKIRGYRLELGEIEAALAAHPDVVQAAVAVSESALGGDATLLAYVVGRPGCGDIARLAEDHAAGRLPGYARPSRILALDALPLTSNGKLDRRALAMYSPAAESNRFVAPRTSTERAIAAIWSECFKREPTTYGIADDFFALGGHSLLAIRVLGKIGRQFGVRLSLRKLFDAPTIERLSAAVDAERAGAAVPGDAIVAVPREVYRGTATAEPRPAMNGERT